MTWLAVMLGGTGGALCRYWLGVWLSTNTTTLRLPWPWPTLVINLLGSFGLGVFLAATYGLLPAGGQLLQSPVAATVGVGFFGSLTTFSTFSVDSVQLWQMANRRIALCYLLLTIGGCLVAFYGGINVWA